MIRAALAAALLLTLGATIMISDELPSTAVASSDGMTMLENPPRLDPLRSAPVDEPLPAAL